MWTVKELRPENVALLWLSTAIGIVVVFFNYTLIKKEVHAQEQIITRIRELAGQAVLPPERTLIESIVAKIRGE
jgi:hypothetical protein